MKNYLYIFFLFLVVCRAESQVLPAIDRSRFEVSSNRLSFSSDGGTEELSVYSDHSWSIKTNYDRSDGWLKCTIINDKIKLHAVENPFGIVRRTSFDVISNGKEITISVCQDAAPKVQRYFEISSRTANFSSNGGEKTFYVTSSHPWRVREGCGDMGKLERNGCNLVLKINPNLKTSSLKGRFVIESENDSIEVVVTQDAAPKIFAISSTSANFSSDGGTKTFTVTSNEPWSVSEDCGSLGTLDRKGNKLTLKVGLNPKTSPRNGKFVIRSGNERISVAISQRPSPVKFTISSSYEYLPSNGGERKITVTAPGEWSYGKVDVHDTWYTLSKDGDKVVIKVDNNNTLNSRIAYFVVKSGNKSETVKIIQQECSPILKVDGNDSDFDICVDYDVAGLEIPVETNSSSYNVFTQHSIIPYYKFKNSFLVELGKNKSSYDKHLHLKVTIDEGKEVEINIMQKANPRKMRRRLNGGTFMWTANYDVDFGGLDKYPYLDYVGNLGFGFKIGNFRDFAQLELGAKVGLNYSNSYCYDCGIYEYEASFRLPLYARLKVNICNFESSALYMSGLFDYNIIRNDRYDDESYVGLGLGIAYRNFEWEIYAKRGLPLSESDNALYNTFVGLSTKFYW